MRRPNHASRFEGIAKTKLQASRVSDTETLQSQVNKAAKKRLSLSGLEILHGRLLPEQTRPATGPDLEKSHPLPGYGIIADENWGLRGSEKRAFWPPRARLVAPTPSMRFVSAHFGALTGRCRGPCQLKTSQQQASQQLRHHFVAVQAFAFACPKVPGRVGPFLRSPFLSPCETRQNCRGSTDRRGTNVGFLDWGR